MSLPSTPKSWVKTHNGHSFLISTDHHLLSLASINTAFASEYMYWATPYPNDVLESIIANSFCFGLYKHRDNNALTQIGFARLITDRVTFAYLTDVYVLPEYQGFGLGRWMMDCVDEVVKPLPHLRWLMLRTASERSVEWYRERFGMQVLDNGDPGSGGVMMGRKGDANMA